MSFIEKLKDVAKDDGISCGDPMYSLAEIKKAAREVHEMEGCWLALDFEGEDDFHVSFALFQFGYQHGNDPDTRVGLVFHGVGCWGSLREMRHIWWGPDSEGYTFYLPGPAVIKALQHLQKYFDQD